MSPTRPLLALACVALLAACAEQVLASGPDDAGAVNQCATKTWGTLMGTIIRLPVVFLNPEPDVTDYDVKIQSNCKGQLQPYGEEAKVCDDVMPTVVFPNPADATLVHVHRNGRHNEAAPVYITQYCP